MLCAKCGIKESGKVPKKTLIGVYCKCSSCGKTSICCDESEYGITKKQAKEKDAS